MAWLAIYPLFATFMCLSGKPLKAELLHWTTFWMAYEGVYILHYFVWWVPFISTLSGVFLVVLYFPPFTDIFRKNVKMLASKKQMQTLQTLFEDGSNLVLSKIMQLATTIVGKRNNIG